MTELNWVEKHRPETFDEVQGNTTALKEIEQWAKTWEYGDPPLLLHGRAGTGKTTTAFIVTEVMGASINQINASDARTADDLERIAKELTTAGVDGEHQLILLDEVDSWYLESSNSVSPPSTLIDALKEPPNPIIMTANEKWEIPDSVKNLSSVEEYEFSLSKGSRRARVRDIAEAEGVNLSDGELNLLADRPNLRSAINALQQMDGGDGIIDSYEAGLEADEWSGTMSLLLGDNGEARGLKPPDLAQWLDANISKEYRGIELALAYQLLGDADEFLGHAWREDYRYWKFAKEIMLSISDIRTTESYNDEWINGFGYPSWFRQKKAESNYSKEYQLFKALKDYEGGSFQFSGNFAYFRRCVLPVLRDLPTEEKFELLLNHGLVGADKEEMGDSGYAEALDAKSKAFHDWLEEEAPETGKWTPPTADALDW